MKVCGAVPKAKEYFTTATTPVMCYYLRYGWQWLAQGMKQECLVDLASLYVNRKLCSFDSIDWFPDEGHPWQSREYTRLLSNFHFSQSLLLLAEEAGSLHLTWPGPSLTIMHARLVVNVAFSRLVKEGRNCWNAEAYTCTTDHRWSTICSVANVQILSLSAINIKGPCHNVAKDLPPMETWKCFKGIGWHRGEEWE